MTQIEEFDENQNPEDGGMTGPGAPTPLTALEVGYHTTFAEMRISTANHVSKRVLLA